jgi:N,N'-diacetylchitobiose phosphorylase
MPHSDPHKCRQRIVELMHALTAEDYGLHLFEPAWFDPNRREQSFRSPTVIPVPDKTQFVHGLRDACSDDALWLVGAVINYVKEAGEYGLLDEKVPYADRGEDTIYDHLRRILDFSVRQVGAHGICKGLRADWNDCLNLGGGESAMVSFLHCWALTQFVELARFLSRDKDAKAYGDVAARVRQTCETVLWDGEWYIRGFTADGRRIGTHTDAEGKIHLESNAWAVLSGAASPEHGRKAMDSVMKYLYTPYGLMLNAPPHTRPDDGIGFVTRVYPGLKENGSIFSHPNPWAWAAMCTLGRGDEAGKLYDALSPYRQNDLIEVRQAEPYSYCQFVVGRAHTAFGRARHPFMTGSAGWAYFAATQYILGVRPDFDGLAVDPCVPSYWKEFEVSRMWRGARYEIAVRNPQGVERGVKAISADGRAVDKLPILPAGAVCRVDVEMGSK